VVDVASVWFHLAALVGWLDRRQQEAMAHLMEENRILRGQLSGRRLQLTDDERRRLAVCGQRLGRRLLSRVATIVTPDTILRWHRQLIARKWTSAKGRPGGQGVIVEIRRLVVRMAEDNPTWGYTRIRGALAERFVRSIKHECLNRVIPFGDRHLRQTIVEFVEHYHRERNHQGLANELVDGAPTVEYAVSSGRSPHEVGRILRRPVLAGSSTITLARC
jgi:hypothetical protein